MIVGNAEYYDSNGVAGVGAEAEAEVEVEAEAEAAADANSEDLNRVAIAN